MAMNGEVLEYKEVFLENRGAMVWLSVFFLYHIDSSISHTSIFDLIKWYYIFKAAS